jgi:arabinan endo-1,5-alpha-L-arabinosidase
VRAAARAAALGIALGGLAGAGCARPGRPAGPAGGPAEQAPAARRAGTYANPVLDADFPDPTVLRASDGFYYAYATQTEVRRPDGPPPP